MRTLRVPDNSILATASSYFLLYVKEKYGRSDGQDIRVVKKIGGEDGEEHHERTSKRYRQVLFISSMSTKTGTWLKKF